MTGDRTGTPEVSAPGPLAGLRVLVPRATDGPDPLLIALHAAGAEPVVVPLIQTVPPDDPTDLDDALLAVEVGYYGWVAVTSAAAVPVLVDRAEETGRDLPTLLGGTRVAAVGGSTARALRAAGVPVDLVPHGRSSAATLLAAWPPVDAAPDGRARVLLPLGDLASGTLADGLRTHGWEVDVVVAYRTVPGPAPEPEVRAAWSAGEVHAVLLTSGSTARNLAAMLGAPPEGTLICCLGAATAAEALRAGLPVHGVAEEQTPAALVAALADVVAGAVAGAADGRTAATTRHQDPTPTPDPHGGHA